MTEIVHTLVKVVLVCGIVILCFWLFKHRTRATIEQNDRSMDAATFPEGGYSVNTTAEALAGVKSGDFVAYRVSAEPNGLRIGRVIALEGNRVEVTPKDILVNGTPQNTKIQIGNWSIPETKIPRGCAFVLADDPTAGMDSKQLGPVPLTSIAGTVKPSH